MTSLSSHEHTHHGCKENSTHTKFYKIVMHTHTHTTNGKAAFVNWKQKGVVKEYSVKAVNPTETEGM